MRTLNTHSTFDSEKQKKPFGFQVILPSAVATGGGEGGRVPHFGLLKILFLEHHVTTRQQTMMGGKRNNYFQIYFSLNVFSILSEIAGNQLLCVNLKQCSSYLHAFANVLHERGVSLS